VLFLPLNRRRNIRPLRRSGRLGSTVLPGATSLAALRLYRSRRRGFSSDGLGVEDGATVGEAVGGGRSGGGSGGVRECGGGLLVLVLVLMLVEVRGESAFIRFHPRLTERWRREKERERRREFSQFFLGIREFNNN